MFRTGMFNLGAEGAFFLGGVGAAFCVLTLPLPVQALAGCGVLLGAVLVPALIAAGAQGLGGLCAGTVEVLGLYGRFTLEGAAGPGLERPRGGDLAGNNPLLAPPAARSLAYLQVGGDPLARNFEVPSEAVCQVQAMVILCATASAITQHPRVRNWLAGCPI